MKETYVDIISIRRMVFAEIARMAFEEEPLDRLNESIFRLLPGEEARYRDSIFKERAVIGERLRLALGLDVRSAAHAGSINQGIDQETIKRNMYQKPLVNVIPFACEACPTASVMVTNNCRKCLAHPCINVCPVNAITMGKTRAHIDHDKCIKCGRCVTACPYTAISRYDRPCAAACGVNAIGSDYLGRAEIDQDKCVSCGRCIQECPFGAIADKSEIYQLIMEIKRKENPVVAIVAPSFAGQFGPLTSPAQVFEAIRRLGFAAVMEVGLGADLTTINEAQEFLDHVPEERPYLGTSCCFSWYKMVEKNFPDQFPYISDSSTPMIYTSRFIKYDYPDTKVVFIGPCISKKLEAVEGPASGYVDYVITYEELMGMFVGAGIEPSEIEIEEPVTDASVTARNYGTAGGVAEAVRQRILEIDPDREVLFDRADSLQDCIKMMRVAKAGKKKGFLLEGMACPGGCVGGPGTLVSAARTSKLASKFAKESPFKSPGENTNLPEHLRK